ncbi:FAD:protein FMN transferase [Bacillus sp. 165]|uniref:FAD:protein FMN transferase n=1 Tax=Bacillus sp. 165 TaxID=1529117 RepID=UPI001AD9EE36|nr:FAD:protein FMN transferase [Bacillus sp. 165]MBO9129402.1 FAD:protein FMN transferase [Bacillus sp. 165]
MKKYTFKAMSTVVEIGTLLDLPEDIQCVVKEQLRTLEAACSRFQENSELSSLNKQLGKEMPVSSLLFDILQKAQVFYEETDGLFNPGILRALEYAGYSKSIEYIRGKATDSPSSPPPYPVQMFPYTLNEGLQAVTLHTKIDLGGMAKGWILDEIGTYLETHGNGFVNIGGDIRIFGSLPHALHIGIEHPYLVNTIVDSLTISSGAIATSTSMKRRWLVNGEWKHHLINPLTGQPSDSTLISCTVAAPTAIQADIWAKTILLLGEEQGRKWLQQKKITAVLLNHHNEIWKGETI